MASDREAGQILKAKYLDWCSARLADRFVRLTPDEIYELAQRASEEADAERGGRAGGVGTELSYHALVARVTEALTERDPLPTFREWARAYEEAPEQFEDELLGLWKEPLKRNETP